MKRGLPKGSMIAGLLVALLGSVGLNAVLLLKREPTASPTGEVPTAGPPPPGERGTADAPAGRSAGGDGSCREDLAAAQKVLGELSAELRTVQEKNLELVFAGGEANPTLGATIAAVVPQARGIECHDVVCRFTAPIVAGRDVVGTNPFYRAIAEAEDLSAGDDGARYLVKISGTGGGSVVDGAKVLDVWGALLAQSVAACDLGASASPTVAASIGADGAIQAGPTHDVPEPSARCVLAAIGAAIPSTRVATTPASATIPLR